MNPSKYYYKHKNDSSNIPKEEKENIQDTNISNKKDKLNYSILIIPLVSIIFIVSLLFFPSCVIKILMFGILGLFLFSILYIFSSIKQIMQ